MADNQNRRSLGIFNVDEGSLDDFEFTFQQTLTSNEPAVALPGTESITESVLNYRVENGRTYHAYQDGAYFLPNDQPEIERLRLCYNILHRSMGNVFHLAPWTATHFPRRVLDVGTGPGDWAIDFAYKFPGTELIIGTDLSGIQPEETPPNVCFVIDDSSQEWLDGDLDYVHTRGTVGCWEDMRTQIVGQAFAKLNPGGWLECQEPEMRLRCDDGTTPPDHGLKLWMDELCRVSRVARKPCDEVHSIRGWLEDAGFVDVQESVFRVPACAWPEDAEQKEIGWWMEEMLAEHVSGISRAYQSRINGLSIEEHELSLIPVRRDIRNRNCHTYLNFHVIIGRKPGSSNDRFHLEIPEPVAEGQGQDKTMGQ